MKTLTLVRHAKAEHLENIDSDIDRPLAERGMQDAPMMAQVLKKSFYFNPDFIISSPALRAHTTAKIFAENFNFNQDNIFIDAGIYERGTKYIINLLKKQSDEYNNIILFGHNPDITSLTIYFLGEYFKTFPTCAVASIEFDINYWSEIEDINGKLKFYEYPKKYR